MSASEIMLSEPGAAMRWIAWRQRRRLRLGGRDLSTLKTLRVAAVVSANQDLRGTVAALRTLDFHVSLSAGALPDTHSTEECRRDSAEADYIKQAFHGVRSSWSVGSDVCRPRLVAPHDGIIEKQQKAAYCELGTFSDQPGATRCPLWS